MRARRAVVIGSGDLLNENGTTQSPVICKTDVCRSPQRPEEQARSPRDGVASGRELLNMGYEK